MGTQGIGMGMRPSRWIFRETVAPWNRLIEGDLDIESNVSASSNDKGERLNRDVVQREDILVSSITKANFKLIKLKILGRNQSNAGKKSEEFHVDAVESLEDTPHD